MMTRSTRRSASLRARPVPAPPIDLYFLKGSQIDHEGEAMIPKAGEGIEETIPIHSRLGFAMRSRKSTPAANISP